MPRHFLSDGALAALHAVAAGQFIKGFRLLGKLVLQPFEFRFKLPHGFSLALDIREVVEVIGGLQNAVGGIGEAIGGALEGAVTKGVEEVGAALEGVGKKLGESLGELGKGMTEGAGKALEGAGEAIEKGVGGALKGIGDGLFGGGKKDEKKDEQK